MSTAELRSQARTDRTEGNAVVWLRRFLALDAAVTGVNGLAYLVASGPIGRLLGVGSGLLLGLGAFLVLYGAGVGYLAGRSRPAVPLVQAVIEANVLWAILSVVALTVWLDEPSTAGWIWVPMQAGTVGGFAVLQYMALRRVRADIGRNR
ncbi:hypothetical protein [Streptomyces acidicola]|uniref:Integral membrane protein n=1 Tax=Streptomyces acidicola TaxID=2596892 RepID=A0A5N8X7S4_9ACTN|nr:hypothetical protein [Streptomyces acidicola]MPY55216.1 hypothetical protein [Streptomyces acidicola]